jgi:excisionase family DNA binding protein
VLKFSINRLYIGLTMEIHMNTTIPQLLLSLNDAAQTIGVCRATFYDLLNQGLIESVKIGTRRLIVQESLHAYIESLRQKNGGAA